MLGINIFRKKQDLGAWGESLAAKVYEKDGYKILDKNFFNRFGKQLGEIDLIAFKPGLIVFVEVKTRTNEKFGTPAEAVDRQKRRKLIQACKYFQSINPQFANFSFRIDVAEVKTSLDRDDKYVNIIENAVEDDI